MTQAMQANRVTHNLGRWHVVLFFSSKNAGGGKDLGYQTREAMERLVRALESNASMWQGGYSAFEWNFNWAAECLSYPNGDLEFNEDETCWIQLYLICPFWTNRCHWSMIERTLNQWNLGMFSKADQKGACGLVHSRDILRIPPSMGVRAPKDLKAPQSGDLLCGNEGASKAQYSCEF